MSKNLTKSGFVLAWILVLSLILSACGDSPAATSTPSTTALATTVSSTTQPTGTSAASTTNPPVPSPGVGAKLADSTLPFVKDNTVKAASGYDAKTPITFLVTLQVPDADDFKKIVGGGGDDQNLQSGDDLSDDDFTKKFAPKVGLNAISTYLQQNGFERIGVAKNSLQARFKGTVGQVESVFKTKINKYQAVQRVKVRPQSTTTATGLQLKEPDSLPSQSGAGGTTTYKNVPIEFFANSGDLTVPSNYIPFIDTIFLNNYPLKSNISSVTAASSPEVGYTPTQLQTAYRLTPLLKDGFDGKGMTIAIYAHGGYKREDLEVFAKTFNLPSPDVENVLVDGATGAPTANALEVTLDIEVIMSVAPRAKILVYQTPEIRLDQMLDAVQQAVTDGRTKIINISYGGCEPYVSASLQRSFNNTMTYARSQGVSVFVSSGDSGAFSCLPFDPSTDGKLAINYPANDPYVVAVGGTALLARNGQYVAEEVWGDSQNKAGGGGGVSIRNPLPSYQQSYYLKDANPQKSRQVPDVSANADNRTGYPVYCTAKDGDGCSGWVIVGGTSASAPLWAAGTLLVNQYLLSKFKPAKGQRAPLFYGPDYMYVLQTAYVKKVIKDAPFFDVTQGNNLYYKAGKTYNLATGLGSPNFANIATGLETLYRNAGYKS